MRKRVLASLFGLFLTACGGKNVASSYGDSGPAGDSDTTSGGSFTAHILRPNGASSILAGSLVTFEAEFSDGNRRVMPATVSWSSSSKGFLGDGNPLADIALDAGQHLITVTGTFAGKAASDSVAVTVSDFAVQIERPRDGRVEDVGADVQFRGRAATLDPGGPVQLVAGVAAAGQRTATFAWSSSRDGVFGDGAADFALATLSQGTHTITLTVTDDLAGGTGRSGSASVALVIAPPNTPPIVTITSPASCPIDLEVGGSLTLTGTVTDPDPYDAGLRGRWTDLMTGETFAGNSATLAGALALGKHTLELFAEDARGDSDRQLCDVYVIAAGGSRADLFPSSTALNDALPSTDISFVGSDGADYTFVGTEQGLTILDASENVVASYSGAELGLDPGAVRVFDVAVSGSQAVIATDAGLVICDYAAGALSNCSVANNDQARALATSGLLVAAATESGLVLGTLNGTALDPRELFDSGNSNLPADSVSDVLFVGSALYVATNEGLCIVTDPGAVLADPTTELCATIFTENNSLLPHDRVTALAADAGLVWIGTAEGLVAYDPSSGAMVLYDQDAGLADDTVRDIAIDAEGIVWVATARGLSRLDPATGLIVNFTSEDFGGTTNDLRSIFIDGQGVKWLGTANGIVRYAGG